jgi:hypothetical protein
MFLKRRFDDHPEFQHRVLVNFRTPETIDTIKVSRPPSPKAFLQHRFQCTWVEVATEGCIKWASCLYTIVHLLSLHISTRQSFLLALIHASFKTLATSESSHIYTSYRQHSTDCHWLTTNRDERKMEMGRV